MSDDVFASDQPSVSVLDTLVGEGKKFDSVEALAKGKAESDAHIARVEQENADMKARLEALETAKAKGENMTEVLEAIKTATYKESSEGGQTMSTEELEQLVRNVVTDSEKAATKASNRQTGNKLVLDLVDGNVEAARQLVTERAAALGMSPTALAALSETSPSAFAELLHQDKSTASSGSTATLKGVNMDAIGHSSAPLEVDGFKTKAYFDAQKREMGHVKWLNNSAQQREFARSMNGLGERFNN